jgi:hypothetical protein
MTLPPWDEVVAAVRQVALPALGSAGAIFLVGRWSRWTAPWAALLALVLGFLVGNHARQGWNFAVGPEDLSPSSLWLGLQATLFPAASDKAPKPPPARTWLPWMVLVALIVGQIAPRLPQRIGWRLRDLVALSVGFLVGRTPWGIVGLTVLILALWETLERLEEPLGCLVPLGLSLTFGVASVVLLHAHSASLTDCATALSAALGGIALASLGKGDARGSYPGVAVALPGLLWVGQQTTSSEVPFAAFLLVALAPLALGGLSLPWWRQRPLWQRATTVGLASGVVLAVALGLTLAYESLPEW